MSTQAVTQRAVMLLIFTDMFTFEFVVKRFQIAKNECSPPQFAILLQISVDFKICKSNSAAILIFAHCSAIHMLDCECHFHKVNISIGLFFHLWYCFAQNCFTNIIQVIIHYTCKQFNRQIRKKHIALRERKHSSRHLICSNVGN